MISLLYSFFYFSFSVFSSILLFFFFFNDTATTEIYTLSLHDALPIYLSCWPASQLLAHQHLRDRQRSEEHTSELQSQSNLVCRLLLEKKKKIKIHFFIKKKKKNKKKQKKKNKKN